MKYLALALALALLPLLAACKSDRLPCTTDREAGLVVSVQSTNQEYCGRGGCNLYTETGVILKMKDGTNRICTIGDDGLSRLIKPGMVISLPLSYRIA